MFIMFGRFLAMLGTGIFLLGVMGAIMQYAR